MTNYRAEIDGLRAIAVVSVILYHAQIVIFGRDWFEGGFIGVDIFFVISGYLITRIILTELEKTNSFSFIKFYERRARRILPMLLLVIAVCIPFAWQKLLPLDLVDFAKSALSAIGFGSNFFFYFSTTEYGADSALLKPLLHTWSLGVEEQFYIVVPIIICLLWKFARRLMPTALFGMFIISILFADVMEGRHSDLNFFLPFSRFWELLVGSVIAFFELKYGRSKNPLLTKNLPIFGLFLIAYSIFFFDANTPHPSFQTLIPIVGVALVLAFCSTEDIVGKLLSYKPIVGVGLISYSLYLWHFPIFAFNRIRSFNPTNFDKLVWIVSAVILSILSYYFIEKTFRNRKIINPKIFILSLIVALLSLIFVNYNFISHNGYVDRLPPILSKNSSDLKTKVWRIKDEKGRICQKQKEDFCGVFNSDELINIYLVGDSHLSAIAPTLRTKIGDNYNLIEMNTSSCPFVLNVALLDQNGSEIESCNKNWQQRRLENIRLDKSIVIIGGRFPAYISNQYFNNMEGGIEGESLKNKFGKDKKTLKFAFKQTIEQLLSRNIRVVLLYPIPEVGVNVPSFIMSQRSLNTFRFLTTDFDVYLTRSRSTFEMFDSVESSEIFRVYPHLKLCNEKFSRRCFTHDNKNVFYVDDDHLSAKGSEMIVELIMEQIKKAEANINESHQQ